MTLPDETAELIRKMLVMNHSLRDLRESIDAGAEVAKAADEPALAFAAFHLSDSIGVYSRELAKFMRKEIGVYSRELAKFMRKEIERGKEEG